MSHLHITICRGLNVSDFHLHKLLWPCKASRTRLWQPLSPILTNPEFDRKKFFYVQGETFDKAANDFDISMSKSQRPRLRGVYPPLRDSDFDGLHVHQQLPESQALTELSLWGSAVLPELTLSCFALMNPVLSCTFGCYLTVVVRG
jgi:hypothetical protein